MGLIGGAPTRRALFAVGAWFPFSPFRPVYSGKQSPFRWPATKSSSQPQHASVDLGGDRHHWERQDRKWAIYGLNVGSTTTIRTIWLLGFKQHRQILQGSHNCLNTGSPLTIRTITKLGFQQHLPTSSIEIGKGRGIDGVTLHQNRYCYVTGEVSTDILMWEPRLVPDACPRKLPSFVTSADMLIWKPILVPDSIVCDLSGYILLAIATCTRCRPKKLSFT